MVIQLRHGVIAALFSLLLLSSSCLTVADDEGPILSVELYWDEEPDNGFVAGECETAGVETMEWHLLDADGEEVETNISGTRESEHPCYNAIDILGLEHGTYTLEISGYDNDGNKRWTQTSAPLKVLRFDVAYSFKIEEG